MLTQNIELELESLGNPDLQPFIPNHSEIYTPEAARANKREIFLAFKASGATEEKERQAGNSAVSIEIEVPRGEELARQTLNPRLGILGGISILGTTGIVKPFSNEAYKETIQAALSVAALSAPGTVVLSTGGRSERFARELLPELPPEAFIQIADFFSFAVHEAGRRGFSKIIHSVFPGKAAKMAQGHPYTHAHSAPMELGFLAAISRDLGYDAAHCQKLSSANTVRHAMQIMADEGSHEILQKVAEEAAAQSARFAGNNLSVRLLLFDYDGRLLTDVQNK
jgi:cobalt-precorrin-5B (C1)-methyltransferase